jgi:hypothetical protein
MIATNSGTLPRIVEKHKGGTSVVTVVRALAADGGELMN